MTETQATQSSAPFFTERGPTGVLLIHGYSGSPLELRPLGAHLAAAGYTVHAPLLAGHGSTPDALFKLRWQDWRESAEAGLRRLRETCREVFVCGFSLGGLLAITLAAHEALPGVLLLAPALRLRGGALLRTTGLLQYAMPWFYPLARANFADPAVRASVRNHAPDANLDDPEVIAHIRRAAKIPVGSIYQVTRLQDQARRDLRRVSAPALIMQGRRDQTVDPRSAAIALNGIRSTDKQLVWFEQSGHQMITDTEKTAVWEAARTWLDAHKRAG